MAIPLIIGSAATGIGIYKGVKSAIDNSDANDFNDRAKTIVKEAENAFEQSRHKCKQSLEDLGQRKVDTLAKNVSHFLENFGKIKNVDFQHDGDLGNMQLKDFGQHTLDFIQEKVSFIANSGLGVGVGLGAGALAAYGAYSGTMALATASTGTAIGTLSGAAATNATLAWLGGGALSAGGMGVAGGMMALGALTTGPAALITGWYMGAKAEEKLDNARSNLAEAERFRKDVNASMALIDGISKVATLASDVLSDLRKHSRRNMRQLITIIDEQGIDYAQYNNDAKMVVMKNVKIIQVIKALLDTPILDEDGNLLGDAESNLQALHHNIQNDFQGALTA